MKVLFAGFLGAVSLCSVTLGSGGSIKLPKLESWNETLMEKKLSDIRV